MLPSVNLIRDITASWELNLAHSLMTASAYTLSGFELLIDITI